jgi:hypothetical protein
MEEIQIHILGGNLSKYLTFQFFTRRRDPQHSDSQYKDIQYNGTEHADTFVQF